MAGWAGVWGVAGYPSHPHIDQDKWREGSKEKRDEKGGKEQGGKKPLEMPPLSPLAI